MKYKLMSRKFWICAAAFLSSIATSISGIASDNKVVIVTGSVCGILSAAIYAFAEAWVDAKGVDIDDSDLDDIYDDPYGYDEDDDDN